MMRRQFRVIICDADAVLCAKVVGVNPGLRGAGRLQEVRQEGGGRSGKRRWGNRGRGGDGSGDRNSDGTGAGTITKRRADGRSGGEQ